VTSKSVKEQKKSEPILMTRSSNGQLYLNYIGGTWLQAKSRKTFQNVNPAHTSDVVGIFQDSDQQDVDMAVTAARASFDRWRLTPAPPAR